MMFLHLDVEALFILYALVLPVLYGSVLKGPGILPKRLFRN